MSSDPYLIASGEAVDEDDLTEEQLEQLEESWRSITKLGKTRRRSLLPYLATFLTTRRLQVIPCAVDYFTGKALQYDQDISDLEDEESEPSEDDSDEDSDGAPQPRRAPTGPKKKGEAEKAEECKNQ